MTGAAAVRLRDGTHVHVRPLQSVDKQLLARAFDRLSPETRYRRFASPMPSLSDAQLAQLTDIDHHDHEALVAIDPATGEALGVARYVRLPAEPNVADAAITIADDWQGRGLGSQLLLALADRGRDEGIDTFSALVQGERQGDRIGGEPGNSRPQRRQLPARAADQVAQARHRRAARQTPSGRGRRVNRDGRRDRPPGGDRTLARPG